jgi:hypothetical protein
MMRGRRILIWGIGLLCVPLLGLGIAAFAFIHQFYPSPPKPTLPPAGDLATAQRQDLDYLVHYFDLDRGYTPEARSLATRLLSQYRAAAGKLSAAQFDLGIARMAALANNGHSRVSFGQLARQHNRLPCRLYHFADGYRVIRARPACRELLGTKVLAMDGRPIEAVADRMFEYVGGPRNHYDQFASELLIESPELLQAAGLADAPDRLTLHVSLRDGSQRDFEISADPADPDPPEGWASAYADQYLSPERIGKEPADWQPLLPRDARLPVFLRDYATPFRSEYWAGERVYYAQLRSNGDEPGHPIGEFLSQVKQQISTDHPRFLILDLRLDQGGDLTKTASFMQSAVTLSASIEHVYVLTSAWTFSAGETSVALAKAHGSDKVTIVGEPVGDRLHFWAEGGSLVLPNSHLNLHFATGLHDYTRSCFGESGCFWILYFIPAHVRNLDPDVRVSYTFDDYVSFRDPLLERALELARRATAI